MPSNKLNSKLQKHISQVVDAVWELHCASERCSSKRTQYLGSILSSTRNSITHLNHNSVQQRVDLEFSSSQNPHSGRAMQGTEELKPLFPEHLVRPCPKYFKWRKGVESSLLELSSSLVPCCASQQ